MSAPADHVPPEGLPARPVRVDGWRATMDDQVCDSAQSAYAAECGAWFSERLLENDLRNLSVSDGLVYFMTSMPAEFLAIARTLEELPAKWSPIGGQDALNELIRGKESEMVVARAKDNARITDAVECEMKTAISGNTLPCEIDALDMRAMAIAAVRIVLSQTVKVEP